MTATTRVGPRRATVATGAARTPRTVAAVVALVAVGAEARPQVQTLVALRLLVGSLLGHQGTVGLVAVVVTDLGWVAASCAVYVLNGLSDLRGDRENGSRRPLAAGRLPVPSAVAAVLLLTTVAVVVASVAGPTALLMLSGYLVLGAAYSYGPWPLKDHAVTASVTVGVAGAATYVFGALASSGGVSLRVVLVGSVLGSWMLVAGNAKDFGDEAGDRLAGRRTLPLLLGARAGRRVVAVAVLGAGAAGTLVGAVTPGARALELLLPAAALMAWTLTSWGPADPLRRPRTAYRVFMWSQFCVNAVLVCGLLVAPGDH